MFGSGMNSAAMAWYILETTRSEVALGTLAVLAAVPAMVLMIFGGVINRPRGPAPVGHAA